VMRVVGLKVLKNRLSEYVRLAANGEIVLVTDRDRVVAELSAPRTGRSPVLGDALLAEAVRNGWLTPQRATSKDPPARVPMASWKRLAEDLAADRDDR
jgi:antitoxin (DNA-binding transcriptional repressor) of toxin-antitoxin stability system